MSARRATVSNSRSTSLNAGASTRTDRPCPSAQTGDWLHDDVSIENNKAGVAVSNSYFVSRSHHCKSTITYRLAMLPEQSAVWWCASILQQLFSFCAQFSAEQRTYHTVLGTFTFSKARSTLPCSSDRYHHNLQVRGLHLRAVVEPVGQLFWASRAYLAPLEAPTRLSHIHLCD